VAAITLFPPQNSRQQRSTLNKETDIFRQTLVDYLYHFDIGWETTPIFPLRNIRRTHPVSFPVKADVARNVIALCRSIDGNKTPQIAMDVSLTRTLAFDSLKLMEFFAGVEQLYPSIALEDWFVEHSGDGRDTLDSAAAYMTRFLAPSS
jgi:acyl carrier protein